MRVTPKSVKMPIFNLVSHRKNCLTKVGSQRHEITSKTYGKHQLTNNAQVAFYPNDADNSGKDWKFQIQYDVERLVSI